MYIYQKVFYKCRNHVLFSAHARLAAVSRYIPPNWIYIYLSNKSLLIFRDLRQALNGWCSGMSRKTPCTFNLQLDHEKSLQWGQGIVDVYYRCVPNEITHRKCNDDVRVSREIGFLRWVVLHIAVHKALKTEKNSTIEIVIKAA